MILLMLLVTLLAVSAVSAANNVTDDVVSLDESSEVIELQNDVVSLDDSNNEKNAVNTQDILKSSDSEDKLSLNNDENVLSAESTVKVTPKLTVGQKTFKTTDTNKKCKVTLKYNNNAIKKAKITLKVNGKTYKTTTNNNGIASFKLTSLTKEGTYKATFSFAGKDKYSKVSTKATLTVSKVSTKLTANDKTFNFNDKTKEYAVTLKTDQNKLLENTKVTLNVNGKTYTAMTNSAGVASFKLTSLTKEGTYDATVKFAGNKNYKSVSKNVKITVKKPVTSKSVTLDVIYSDDKFPHVELSNKDVISTNYEKYSGRQWSPGVYARVSYGLGLLDAKYTKLVKCTVWFKNSNGNVITKTSSNFQYNSYIKVGLESGYTPYKAQIWYENK